MLSTAVILMSFD